MSELDSDDNEAMTSPTFAEESTGHAGVDAAIASVRSLKSASIGEQVAGLEGAHGRLHDILAELDGV